MKIQDVKSIREDLGLTHIVIFGVDAEGQQHVATHGLTVKNAEEAADFGNELKKLLKWPDKCQTKPLKRVCSNCHFFEKDYGYHCFNGWSKDGRDGFCCAHIERWSVKGDRIGCQFFEPGE